MHFLGIHAPVGYRKKYILTLSHLSQAFYPSEPFIGSFGRFWLKTVIKNLTRNAKAVALACNQVKKDVIEIFGAKEENLVVIPLGISTPSDEKKSNKNLCIKDL